MKFFNSINLNKNQIINVALHSAISDPSTPVDGQIYYNSTSKVIKYYNQAITAWVTLGTGAVSNVIGGQGLTGTNVGGVITLDVNVDNATVEIVGDIVRIKDLGVSTAKIANSAVTTAKIADGNVSTVKVADGAISFAKIQNIPTMTVIGRVAGGTGVSAAIPILDEDDMASDSATSLATQQSIKAYVDATVGAIGKLIGGFDASTATNFPGTSTTIKGDYWYVTVAGVVQGVSFNVGDVIIANKNNPSTTTAGDYIFLETNRDQATTTTLGVIMLATSAEVNAGTNNTKAVTPQTLAQRTATETRTGIIEIATVAEATAGTDDARAITPAKLKSVLDAAVGGYTTTIGDGITLTYIITHNLNTQLVIAALYEVATNELVYADITAPTLNTVQVAFTQAPTTNQFRVVIKK